MSDHRVAVKMAGHGYDVIVGRGLLARIGNALRPLAPHDTAVVITDDTVGPLYADAVSEALRHAGYTRREVFPMAGGENHKTLDTFTDLAESVVNARIDRRVPIIALGGGIVGDVAGFVAASVLRGVPFIQVPTTLLAMVDASVGGKTGVNTSAGKNLVGAFKPPGLVLIDTDCLQTLPEREFRSGLAECVKHDVIRDAAHFELFERSSADMLRREPDALANLIAHNVAIKAAVVEEDPFERGVRAHLNFGHTFGHAFEIVSDYTLTHGECVALGMVAAGRLAVALKLFSDSDAGRVTTLLKTLGLPTDGLKLNIDAVLDAMTFDKKASQDGLKFVLPTRIGEVVVRGNIDPLAIRAAVESLGA